MKIEIRNIRHNPLLSVESEAFSASLFINGIIAGIALNHGLGGETFIDPKNNRGVDLIDEAEQYCSRMPSGKFKVLDKEFPFNMNLGHFVYDLLKRHLQQKELQRNRNRLARAMKKGIVIGMSEQHFRKLEPQLLIGTLLSYPKGREILQRFIAGNVLPQLQSGEKVLNTNIPEKILKAAGLPQERYVQQNIRQKKIGTARTRNSL